MMKILLAEDEQQLSRVLETAMTHEGYQVDTAFDGQEAVDLAKENAYDLMILDIMMPVKTGIEALKEIRQTGNTTHVIMLTAMSEVDDKVTGLDAGADDYLTKPFSLKELLARLRSMSRRVATFTPNLLQIGQTSLNVGEHELISSNSIRLAGKESKMMEFLMLNAQKSLSTQEIFRHVWSKDEDEDLDEGFVWIYISYLRQKLKAIHADLAILGEEGGSFTLVPLEGDSHVSET
ncbi:DNA-binding response regulator [Streptococcus sanguinis SK1 = NCTC 7863]|jgi:two-component response transcriptional regulator (cheY-like receiver and winged-helix DNA-binding domains), putative|uniref:Transcriptional regulatory protein DltR n=3 Tax=Streptococcus sanguinis TaxID=1305 RepID=F2CC10_STRSA|nr:response regulator transcription factor [Streptococcus sanguinis]EGC25570.1 response regulator receiver domain protein [Streptococcus sanguinis SK405]EGC26950.1 response regulator receiver domain protein [Streptococcus sanguinis SK678]EGF09241.1 DNA-binding response regulator [Streptococcus sanguinis SK1 = NCTC 7863]EGF19929.1 DNA-binding response regulator [Streptococcus sanguinis SK408]MBZ2076202.1 response regulator transcription factor [Streptococcus sanguinis]